MKSLNIALFIVFLAQASYSLQVLKLPDMAITQKFDVQGKILLPKGKKLNKGAPSNITVF